MRNKLLTTVALFVVSNPFVHGSLEFSGYAQDASEIRFSLADTADNSASGWLRIGQQFKGYTVVSFASEREILTVKKGSESIELSLKAASVRKTNDQSASINARLAAEKQNLTELLTRYGEQHPKVVEQVRRIAALEQQLSK